MAKPAAVAAAVLAGVVIAREQERVGHVTPESPGHVDEANKADDDGCREDEPLRAEGVRLVDLEGFGLAVDDQPQRPSDGHDRQRLVGRVKRQASHGFKSSPLERTRGRREPDISRAVLSRIKPVTAEVTT